MDRNKEKDHLERQPVFEKADQLAQQFERRAATYDREGKFPFENFTDLKQAGFLALTVPVQYGGKGFDLSALVELLKRIARGDASTALGLGWHLGIVMNLRDTEAWSEERFGQLCADIVQTGALINSCATEPETGSPSRGGKPQTNARKTETGWVIEGRKTWSTLSPLLRYFLISASIEGSDDVGEFVILRDTPGLSVQETWDSLGMRATGSHDVLLHQVELHHDGLLERRGPGQPSRKSMAGGGWLLHIPACYLGVAEAAQDFALKFAKTYQPNSLSHPIAELPAIQEKLGKMELELWAARRLLSHTAKEWDLHPEKRLDMKTDLAAVKHLVTNTAVSVVDLAMRVVGGRSLLKEYPLERYYRDVRAGLHNPPMDDVTIAMLAKKVLSS